ncbi:probable terpene synthase 11 [Olea europaea var. sylvestris]|uniref:probable terpene synthase 11 n=1 Tax=Olea europaea var. sylvestris TaxID=158386 RepID=UPI000C1D83FC|nr:probable terpene synthase 11 [Olea europaea var. sylvestris]
MLPQSHIALDRHKLRESEKIDESAHKPLEQQGRENVIGNDRMAIERIDIAVVSAIRSTNKDFNIERTAKLGVKVFTGTVDPAVAQAWMTKIERVLHTMENINSSERIEELRENTRKVLRRALDPMAAMELIDTLQWIGIAYNYEEEIDSWLNKLISWDAGDDLHATALRFRLLRSEGLPVSCDVFKKFMEKNGKFKESISQDTRGLLSLYEASSLGASGEDILSEAMRFAVTQLRLSMPSMGKQLCRQVTRALELPRHLRMARLESRLYIDEYSMGSNFNQILLEQAKLDYNKVQSLHQIELAELSRWWKQLGLVEKLKFGRDRPMECYFWTVGILPDPKYSQPRIELAKTIAILLVIDDIFDTYGSINELLLFNDAIQKWNLDAIEQLPAYMKICYMALYNTSNEIAYNILKEQGRNVLPSLKRVWMNTIEAFMIEANWFSSGHVPDLANYLKNAVTTSGSYMALVHIFFLLGEGISHGNVKSMEKPYPKIFSCSGQILRLWDDLGTSKEEQDRGDNASSIPLFMKEKNLPSEGEARECIMQLIGNLWKELNTELLSSSLPLPIIRACFNMSRTSQVIYQHEEDSYSSGVDNFVKFLLLEPIGL